MSNEPIIFDGSIPQHYQDYLTPFLFDPYSADIIERIGNEPNSNVLELASGTGSVTKLLLQQLPKTAHLTATDLMPDMLNVAKQNISAPNITWDTVDMTAIPYPDNQFDLIVCQFGLMLVPEKLKALTEMYRVLKPNGRLLFSVWGAIEANKIWQIGGEVVQSFLGVNLILQNPGPFAMYEKETLELIKASGFLNVNAVTVNKTGTIATAALAAKGFILGLPVVVVITQKNPTLLPQIEKALELELIKQLGDHPLQSSLQALVFEAIK